MAVGQRQLRHVAVAAADADADAATAAGGGAATAAAAAATAAKCKQVCQKSACLPPLAVCCPFPHHQPPAVDSLARGGAGGGGRQRQRATRNRLFNLLHKCFKSHGSNNPRLLPLPMPSSISISMPLWPQAAGGRKI